MSLRLRRQVSGRASRRYSSHHPQPPPVPPLFRLFCSLRGWDSPCIARDFTHTTGRRQP